MKYIITPHITEKSYRGITEDTKGNQTYVFRVSVEARKEDIKKMVESAYKVHVADIHTVRLPGKVRRFKGITGHTNATKKALVRLYKGERIAAFDTSSKTADKE